MICRIWRGWTTSANADAYERIVRNQVIPGIEGMHIPGFRHIDLMRRAGPEVEFVTIMWFDSLEAVRTFAGQDYEVAVVPPAARVLLSRYDARSAHYDTLARRVAAP